MLADALIQACVPRVNVGQKRRRMAAHLHHGDNLVNRTLENGRRDRISAERCLECVPTVIVNVYLQLLI